MRTAQSGLKEGEIAMFKNIGGKIQKLAVIFTVIGFILSILSGVALILGGIVATGYSRSDEGWIPMLIGIGVIIFGCLMSWISSFVLYAYGSMAKNLSIIAQNSFVMATRLSEQGAQAAQEVKSAQTNSSQTPAAYTQTDITPPAVQDDSAKE